MKITRPPQEFQPVNVILESQEEVNTLRAIAGLNITIPEKFDFPGSLRRPDAVAQFLHTLHAQLMDYK